MRLTHEDFRDIRDVNPFVLTEESLWFYTVSYKGIEPIDGMDCYTLHVRPRQILYDQRFFDGLVWVGKENGQVVRVSGRPVPQIHRLEGSNLFPAFTTQYAPVDGEHWFPVRTEGDDILPFPSGNQRVKLLIEYSQLQAVHGRIHGYVRRPNRRSARAGAIAGDFLQPHDPQASGE